MVEKERTGEYQIKESIVNLLKKNSEFGLTRNQMGSKFVLFPIRIYSLLLELVNERKIEIKKGYYFIKK